MPEYYVGLMSGTSMDSIDAALVDFSTEQPILVSRHNLSWPAPLHQDILSTQQLIDEDLKTLNPLDVAVGEIFADAVNALINKANINTSDVVAIGSHGQTIRHKPNSSQPFSLQIGNAQVIADNTKINVVSDFRTADINAGGQGAPLVPAFHRTVFQSSHANRVIVNIGGMANITVLPKNDKNSVSGFDTGPGNGLMDAWIKFHSKHSYDASGKLAASGKTNARLLANYLMDDYFQQPPPKSTGFEHFNLGWINEKLNADENIEDVQSTLCDLTATSIVRAINQYANDADEIYVCGGGVHNSELMRRLQSLNNRPVKSTDELGVEPDWVEAMTFAWLARQTINNKTGNLPSVTGARSAVVLGEVTIPSDAVRG